MSIAEKIKDNMYLQLFWVFFKLGLFTIGGGMAAASAFPPLASCASLCSHSAPPTGKESPGHETKDGPGRKKARA